MPIVNRVAELQDEMTAWRRELHRHPETAFQEVWTSDFVAAKLESFGIEVHRGIATTGLVGVLRGQRDNGRTIGLRADMDALDITEANEVDYASETPGKMHACGHDGHTTMLLGAARYLAETRNFDGTVHFIFQPAEEGGGGGKVMVEEGLFERFPCEEVYGIHNSPGLPVGKFATRPGPMLASADSFEIVIEGYGTHAARPHQGIDPVIVQAQIVLALQTIASRNLNPIDSIVLSITQVHGGEAFNIIPQRVVLRGTVRAFKTEVQDLAETRMRALVESIAAANGATATVHYERRYPPTVNHATQVAIAADVAREVFGEANVTDDGPVGMGSEDFSYMLQARPGAFVRLGNGREGEHGGVVLHNPRYDFNDEALAWGASFWARLVERTLPRG